MRGALNRRQALAAMGMALAGFPQGAAARASDSLAAIAARRGLRFGSALGVKGFGDASYRKLLQDECGILVCENEMKWKLLRPAGSAYDFGNADRITAFARRSGMDMRGHALVFHTALNQVWQDEAERLGAETALVRHIETTVTRYAHDIFSWDVVNEPIDPNSTRPDRLRATPMLEALGPRYIDIAFHAARAANPEATLVLNDWVVPYRAEFFARHRSSMLELLTRLKRDGVPVDALGIQGHLVAGRNVIDAGAWTEFLGTVADLGLRILITELDVADSELPPDIASRDAALAEHAKLFLDVTLNTSQVTDVITWGLADSYSAVRLYHPRKDKLPIRSLPYDARLAPKPLRTAIAAALAAAPAREQDQGRVGE